MVLERGFVGDFVKDGVSLTHLFGFVGYARKVSIG